jgi:hypothetical protein
MRRADMWSSSSLRGIMVRCFPYFPLFRICSHHYRADAESYSWMEPAVVAATALVGDASKLAVRVHLTRSEPDSKADEEEEEEDDKVQAERCRPHLADIVHAAHRSCAGRVAIIGAFPIFIYWYLFMLTSFLYCSMRAGLILVRRAQRGRAVRAGDRGRVRGVQGSVPAHGDVYVRCPLLSLSLLSFFFVNSNLPSI